MLLQDLLEHCRKQLDDSAPPYLWDDDELLLWAVEAQDMLVRAVGGISDTTVAAADIGSPQTRLQDLAVTPSVPYVAHSPYILRIRSARLVTGKLDLQVIDEADMSVVPVRDYGWTRGIALDDTDTGQVRFMVLGMKDNTVRWARVPDANGTDTCRLHVYRLPYPRIAKQEDALEVGEEHHLNLVEWIKCKAYSKEDAETYDKKLAETNRLTFEAYCEKARREAERKRFKPRRVQMSCPGY